MIFYRWLISWNANFIKQYLEVKFQKHVMKIC